jgi:dipeptidyl-peptidase-4
MMKTRRLAFPGIYVSLLSIAVVPFALVGCGGASAQDELEITVDWIYSDASGELTALPAVRWTNDGSALLYDTRRPENERTIERFHPVDGRTEAVDREEALASLREILGPDSSPEVLTLPASYDAGGRRGLYTLDGDIFVLDFEEAAFTRITRTEALERSAGFSPDGNRVAFVRDNDLYVYDLTTDREHRLTDDGTETILNGTLSWVYWEEIFGRRDIGYWWSDDSESIAFLQTDESQVGLMHYVDFRPNLPNVITQRYPKTGTTNPEVRVGVVDIDSGSTTWMDLSDIPFEYIIRVQWLPDNRRLSVQSMNRSQDTLDLYFFDSDTGGSDHILTEVNEGWVNIHDDLHFLPDDEHFIWASERDGYMHLYRYAMDGTLVNQVTSGPWAIASSGGGMFWVRQAVVAIDWEGGWVYFTGMKDSSLERHLYRVRMDGTGMEKISDESGTHGISFSPDARFYFDTYSTISRPPSLSLYDSEGQRIEVLAEARTDLADALDIQTPELTTIHASDGFPLPAQFIKPKDFDPSREYPVVLFVYGGPSAPSVSNAWQTGNGYFNQILVREGFLSVIVDNRSATAISKDLENTILRNSVGPSELNDIFDAVRWLRSQSYVDQDRIGIWGWSGGGTMTLAAMTHSDLFRAGIAVAAVTDWDYYDTKWAEAYMKRPQENPEGYRTTSLVERAGDLTGRLLLVHGTYDDNVHPQNAWAFTEALIQNGILFDMQIYPMRKHGIADRPARIHLYNTMLEFWREWLG